MSTAEAKPAEPESKSFVQEFQEFIARGNAIDMAVGLVMGTAFNKIVTSIVNDLIMPPIGMLIQGVDFKELKIWLQHPDTTTTPPLAEVSIKIGEFLNVLIEFFIVALSVFFAVKVVNAMMAYRVPFLTPAEEAAVVAAAVEEKKKQEEKK